KPRVRDSKYCMEQMLLAKQDEAGVTLTDEQNDFLVADATRMEEIKELSTNICLMARIQPANIDSDAGPSYDSAFLSEVQTPSTSYVNPLFAKDNQEQKYLKQPKIINDTISGDQIDSNIIFDEPNVDVNSGSVEYDNNVQALYELKQLARNAYKEAEKQQIIANKGKRLEKDLQTQFIRDRDIIRDQDQKWDNLQLSVVELKRQIVELQKTQTILKRKMSENEDKYHDIVLDLEARAKENENVVLKIDRTLQAMFLLGPKPMSFYDPNSKHGLGYQNTYTLKKAISQNPKIYDASCFGDTKIHVNVKDIEDILDDATKSQKKMENKLKDPIAIEKKQNAKLFLASMPSPNPMKLYLEKMENEFKTLFASLQTNSKRDSIFYTTPEDIKEMKDVFDSTESDLCATWKQNELLKDQLLEAKLKHEIECYVRAKNQDLLITISELKTELKNVEKGLKAASSVRRPSNRDSPFKNSVLSNTKKSSEKVEVSVRTNKKTYVASKNVFSDKKIVTDVDIIDSGYSKHMTGDHTLLENFVEKFMGTVRFRNDHFAAITGYGDYVQGDITVCHVYYVDGLGHNLFRVGQFCDGAHESNLFTTSISDMVASSPVCLISKATSTKSWLWHRKLSHLNFGTINDLTKLDLVDGLLNSNTVKIISESMNTPSKEDLDNLFGPMYEEYFEKRSSEVSIKSTAQQVHNNKDSPSTSSIIVTSSKEQTSPILINKADELNQEDFTEFDGNTLFTPYDALNFDQVESSTIALDPSNMQEFHQVQPSTHIWTKSHPLEQVIGDPSKLVMTQNRLQTDSKLCMYALTVNTFEPKNIKQAMSDHIWIESMQYELHQIEKLDVWCHTPNRVPSDLVSEGVTSLNISSTKHKERPLRVRLKNNTLA
ncbi:integrase, catalytic region, zinc finger, CCHC-type containing protein, partial [Tanacetum coccineum]